MKLRTSSPSLQKYISEREEFWRNAIGKIPRMSFPSYWSIRIVPPIAMADARFYVEHMFAHVSVYLDLDCALGSMYDDNNKPTPYWEIFPDEHGDNARFVFGEECQMIDAIERSLIAQNTKEIEEL